MNEHPRSDNPRKSSIDDPMPGEEECYWCGQVLPQEKMRPENKMGVRVFVCPNCQPA